MSVTANEWNEYEEYLQTLTEPELKIELEWLKSVGKAKQRGSSVTTIESYTLQ